MRVLALAALVACTTSPAEPSKSTPKPEPVKPVVPAKPAPSACGTDQDELISKAVAKAGSMFMAMDPQPREARDAWSAVLPACRDGRWYYAGVLLQAWASSPIEAGATKFSTVEEVLTAAIAAKVDDEQLFARIAYNAGLGNKPAPPSDACDRAKKVVPSYSRGQSAAYTCAREALAKGDGKLAGELAASIRPRSDLLDLDLVAALAAKATGDKAAMKTFATAASKVTEKDADRARVSRGDAKLVAAAAKALLK